MKKVIKYGMFLILVLALTIAFSNSAFAETTDTELKHCIDYNYDGSETCPEKDDYGMVCDTDTYGYCKQKGKQKLTCEDYYSHSELCVTDELGNDCTIGEDNLCRTYYNYGAKTCEDYSYADCPVGVGDDLGDTCAQKDNKCVIVTNQSDVNRAWTDAVLKGEDPLISIYKDNDVKLIEDDIGFVCSDVKFLTNAWLFIRILSPFLIVLFGSLDFFKAMIANDEKKMKQARGNFVKRLIAFLLLIILPFVLQFIFSTIGTFGSENVCLLKCIATNDTSEKGCD